MKAIQLNKSGELVEKVNNNVLDIHKPGSLRRDLRYLMDFYLVNHDENELVPDRQGYYDAFVTIDQLLMDIEAIAE